MNTEYSQHEHVSWAEPPSDRSPSSAKLLPIEGTRWTCTQSSHAAEPWKIWKWRMKQMEDLGDSVEDSVEVFCGDGTQPIWRNSGWQKVISSKMTEHEYKGSWQILGTCTTPKKGDGDLQRKPSQHVSRDVSVAVSELVKANGLHPGSF